MKAGPVHSKLWSVAVLRAEEMGSVLRLFTAHAKHWRLVPSTQLTATCNSHSGGADSLF